LTDILLGDSYILQAVITDLNGKPVIPTSQVARLYDPDHILKGTDAAPALKSAGTYWATFSIPIDGRGGVWEIVWAVNSSGIIDSEKFYFKVGGNP
jgi:hypothetical protein